MKKLLIALSLSSILLFSGCGKKEPKNYMSVIIGRQNNILYVHNLNGVRNDDSSWSRIDLYEDVSLNIVQEAVKMDFKTGDMIYFKGYGWGGWHDISEIKIISHDNPISQNK